MSTVGMKKHKPVSRWQALLNNWIARNLGDGYQSWHDGPEQGELPGFESYDEDIIQVFTDKAIENDLFFMLSVNRKVIFDAVHKNPGYAFEKLVVLWDNYRKTL